MTLVLTLATETRIWQSSDRRFTYHPSGQVKEEHGCKKVLLELRDSSGLLAYTGLAELGRPYKDTAAWAAHLLAGEAETWRHGVELLRTRTPKEIRQLGVRHDARRHAFIMAGWSKAEVEPQLAIISNFSSSDLSAPPADAMQEEMLAADPVAFVATGATVSQAARDELCKMALGVSTDGDEWEVMRSLVQTQRKVADENRTVGRSSFVSLRRPSTTGARGFQTDKHCTERPPLRKHEALEVFVPWNDGGPTCPRPYYAGIGMTWTDQGVAPWAEEYLRRKAADPEISISVFWELREQHWKQRGYEDQLDPGRRRTRPEDF